MDNENSAEQAAVERLLQVQPIWCGVETATEAIALEPMTLLHAGPPLKDLENLPQPIFNSAVLAILYEEWANTIEQANQLIRTGQVRLRPAQDWQVVTPLAAVVSPSMKLQKVSDRHNSARVAYSPIHGGSLPALRFGTLNFAILERLQWLNHVLAPLLEGILTEPIALIPLADLVLKAGQECHSLTSAGTQALITIFEPRLKGSPQEAEVISFFNNSPSFFLNLWMAACKCILQAAENEPGSNLVTTMAGNGRDFGLQLSGLPRQWVTVPAQPPYAGEDRGNQNYGGAVGDSAVIDALGFGGMALSYAPKLATEIQAAIPEEAFRLPSLLLRSEHPSFSLPRPRLGLIAQRVVETGYSPLVNLAILDNNGNGMIGRGVYRPPVTLFEQAVAQLTAHG